ncbi:MAG: acetyl-CoA carboxylase biotin carboxyl carrier protein subunit, partial [Lachnospiraceae bacterium]|nr:acetyl-CoA carboxylase biotin carboxyl carrier protein subunit [Lachnospiraceae bacterium]
MKNYTITVNGNVYDVTVEEGASTGAVAAPVKKAAPKAAPAAAPAAAPKASGAAGSIRVEAGAAGKVFKLDTKVGDTVKKGDAVITIEAMKM